MLITANLKTPKLSPAAQKAEENQFQKELIELKKKFNFIPDSEAPNPFFSQKLTEKQQSADLPTMRKKFLTAKTTEERIKEVKLEYYRTLSVASPSTNDEVFENNLDLETYLKEWAAYEVFNQTHTAAQFFSQAETALKEKKYVFVKDIIKELKAIEKKISNPVLLKEKMTKDFKDALVSMDDNGDEKISAREFNQYQVRSYLKWLLIETFSWERDIPAKKRPTGSPLYKKLENEANAIIKSAEAQLKKELEAQEASAIMNDEEETEALKDFKEEPKDPS
jgi:hypothetical protein